MLFKKGASNPVAKLDVAGGIAVNNTLVVNSSGEWVGVEIGI